MCRRACLLSTLTQVWAACWAQAASYQQGYFQSHRKQQAAALDTRATRPARHLGLLQGSLRSRRDRELFFLPLAFCLQPLRHVSSDARSARGDSNSAETQPSSLGDLPHPGQMPDALMRLLQGGSRQMPPHPVSQPLRQLSLLCGEPGTPRLLAGVTRW